MSSFRVKGKIFCTVPPDGKRLHIPVGADEVRALVAEDPKAFEVIIWGKREVSDWLRVHLPNVDAAHVKELLEDAWRAKAPSGCSPPTTPRADRPARPDRKSVV